MINKKIVIQFLILTFSIAYLVSGVLIFLGPFGYRVYNWVNTLQQFCMNIPFAIYIFSPALASYIVLKRNDKIANLKKWLKTVFYVKNNIYPYLFVIGELSLYFLIQIAVSGRTEKFLPYLYTFSFSSRRTHYRWSGGSWLDVYITA